MTYVGVFGTPILLGLVASLGIGVVMIIGAVKMMRLQSHRWAMTASILALLPCSPVSLLGLAAGIWSLVVLNRRGVVAAFAAHAARKGTSAAFRVSGVAPVER